MLNVSTRTVCLFAYFIDVKCVDRKTMLLKISEKFEKFPKNSKFSPPGGIVDVNVRLFIILKSMKSKVAVEHLTTEHLFRTMNITIWTKLTLIYNRSLIQGTVL